MRFLKSIAALALLATPTVLATTILPDSSVYNPIFQDPYSNNPDLLLGISVLTPCPNSLEVTVNVPVVDGSLETVTGTFGNTLNHNLAEQVVPGSYNSLNAGAAISATYGLSTTAGQTSSRWTFRNFQQFAPCTVVPAGWDPTQCFRIVVDVLDDALTTANPGFQITPQGGFVSLNTKAYFQVSQWTDTCNKGPSNPGGSGDPIFSGFQGQNFQFHGLPDEHFNLVSSPDVQLNSHFVYLSSGKCDYNDTECFTHPGTYMDVLGLSVGESHVKLVAGTHEQGLRVWVNDAEIQRGAHIKQLAANVTGSLRYHHNGKVDIHTDIMGLEIANSDMFMNIRASLNDQQLLSVGSKKHTVTDKAICKTNSETHNHQLIEQTVSKKYPVTTPLHGLIGQTWRNVKVCGKDWMGTVQDYLVSDLFASDNHYNYFKW